MVFRERKKEKEISMREQNIDQLPPDHSPPSLDICPLGTWNCTPPTVSHWPGLPLEFPILHPITSFEATKNWSDSFVIVLKISEKVVIFTLHYTVHSKEPQTTNLRVCSWFLLFITFLSKGVTHLSYYSWRASAHLSLLPPCPALGSLKSNSDSCFQSWGISPWQQLSFELPGSISETISISYLNFSSLPGHLTTWTFLFLLTLHSCGLGWPWPLHQEIPSSGGWRV